VRGLIRDVMATWLGSHAAWGRVDGPNSRVLLGSRLWALLANDLCIRGRNPHRDGNHWGSLAALSQDTQYARSGTRSAGVLAQHETTLGVGPRLRCSPRKRVTLP
jgi:hypothetical protein